MKVINLSDERKAQLLNRLAEIDNKAENVNGYYVLREKEKTTVFCNGRLLEPLEHNLKARRGSYCAGSTCYKFVFTSNFSVKYIGVPIRNEYGYCLTVQATAKKTTEYLNAFLKNSKEFVNEYYNALERVEK